MVSNWLPGDTKQDIVKDNVEQKEKMQFLYQDGIFGTVPEGNRKKAG
jgi:hypothetical protein